MIYFVPHEGISLEMQWNYELINRFLTQFARNFSSFTIVVSEFMNVMQIENVNVVELKN